MFAPSKFIWQGHTTLQSNLICLFISITDGATVPKLLWPWGDGKVMRHRVDIDHYWFNREAAHSGLMLSPFLFPTQQHCAMMPHKPVVRTRQMRECEGLRDVAKCLWWADRGEKGNGDKNRLGRKLRRDWRGRDGSAEGPQEHGEGIEGWAKGSWCEGKLYLNCCQGYMAVVLDPGFTVIAAGHCH